MNKYWSLLALPILTISLTGHAIECRGPSCNRPPRAKVFLLNPEMDSVKPVAQVDPAGWTMVGDNLVGSYDKRWLAAYSMGRRISPRWWFSLVAPIVTPILSHDKSILFGIQDGSILKLDAETGKQQ